MLWFDGTINSAVDKVKSSGVFLLVFVQGEDSLSKQYESYLNEEMNFESDVYVAIKIRHNSTAFQQFKDIYISVPVPSIFLIQNNGIPLKVISSQKISDLHYAISDAINKQNVKKKKKNALHSNGEKFPRPVCESEKVTSKPKQLINNVGQCEAVDPSYLWLPLNIVILLNCCEVLNRKFFDISQEDIKRRIKELRAFPKFLLIDSTGPSSLSNSPPEHQSARIQFRLPNNTTLSWEFPNLSTLRDVRVYLMEKTKLSPNFKLLRTYPRTVLTSQDENKTLVDLSLCPSATLIVVPVEDKTVQAKVTELLIHRSLLSNILNVLLGPLITVIDFFKKHVLKVKNEDNQTPRRLPSDTEVEKIFNKKTSTSSIRGYKFEEDRDTDAEHTDKGNSTQKRFQD